MAGSYDDFFEALGQRESSGNYQAVNKFGYLGKYQMGEAALQEAGFYIGDGTSRNDWRGKWTGKDGVRSKQDFLENSAAQECAVRLYARKNWSYIKSAGLDNYIGKRIADITITESGMLAAVHLKGVSALKRFLQSNGRIDLRDGLGTEVSEYLEKFGGYQTPFDKDPFGDPYNAEFQKYLRYGVPPKKTPRQVPDEYIWRSMGDGKVRPSHKLNNGKTFRWNDPPSTGHPGTEPGCRCWAESILNSKVSPC